ncbi:hypothetical protein PHYPO_G00075840 [Pangasianodon hypophthalmus]|uniref:Uncharacterized protein n=1 Tax=Pangasianodon hypophthalmus TaxID=310915 RepID=A0A5N5LVP4_PANHP|nr:hypothetical protein PHYPO_G00075840 [Pangasianodon hypophthalmus]
MMEVVLLCLFGSLTALPVPRVEEMQSGSGDFIVTGAADSVPAVSSSPSSTLLPLPQSFWRSPGRTHTQLQAPEENFIPVSEQRLEVTTPNPTASKVGAKTLSGALTLPTEVPNGPSVTESTEPNHTGTPPPSTLTAPPSELNYSPVNTSLDTSLPVSGLRGMDLKRAHIRPRSAENAEDNENAENTRNDGENKRNTVTSGKGKKNTVKGGTKETKAAAKGGKKETGNGQNAKTEKVQSADFSFEFDGFGWLVPTVDIAQ